MRVRDAAIGAGSVVLGILGFVLSIAWMVGATIGAYYWWMQDWMNGVVLSLVVPFFGVISTLLDVYR